MALLVTGLLILTYFFIPCISINMLGPANLIYKTVENCETKATEIDAWITQRKYNRTTNVLDIKFASPWPINDDIIMEVTAEVKKEGGYKPGSFHIKDTMCNVLRTMLGDMFNKFLEATGTDDCPMPEGAYEIKDFLFDNEKFNVPQIYGEYRLSVLIFKGEDLKGCYYVFLNMVPKYE